MLVLVPIMVVVIAGSELMMSPFKLHVTFKGSSPLFTLHVTWTNSPSFTASSPNENGTICGGSEKLL